MKVTLLLENNTDNCTYNAAAVVAAFTPDCAAQVSQLLQALSIHETDFCYYTTTDIDVISSRFDVQTLATAILNAGKS